MGRLRAPTSWPSYSHDAAGGVETVGGVVMMMMKMMVMVMMVMVMMPMMLMMTIVMLVMVIVIQRNLQRR